MFKELKIIYIQKEKWKITINGNTKGVKSFVFLLPLPWTCRKTVNYFGLLPKIRNFHIKVFHNELVIIDFTPNTNRSTYWNVFSFLFFFTIRYKEKIRYGSNWEIKLHVTINVLQEFLLLILRMFLMQYDWWLHRGWHVKMKRKQLCKNN